MSVISCHTTWLCYLSTMGDSVEPTVTKSVPHIDHISPYFLLQIKSLSYNWDVEERLTCYLLLIRAPVKVCLGVGFEKFWFISNLCLGELRLRGVMAHLKLCQQLVTLARTSFWTIPRIPLFSPKESFFAYSNAKTTVLYLITAHYTIVRNPAIYFECRLIFSDQHTLKVWAKIPWLNFI